MKPLNLNQLSSFSNEDIIDNSYFLYPKVPKSVVARYKSGNKIRIKKKNKGKFTEYCDGNVTDECIKRGKNSSDPAVRKRATFAQNARRWKK